MASRNFSTPTEGDVPQKPLAVSGQCNCALNVAAGLLYEAFATGAESVNRVGVLIDAAIRISESPNVALGTVKLLSDLLTETRHLAEELAGMLESERDSVDLKGCK